MILIRLPRMRHPLVRGDPVGWSPPGQHSRDDRVGFRVNGVRIRGSRQGAWLFDPLMSRTAAVGAVAIFFRALSIPAPAARRE